MITYPTSAKPGDGAPYSLHTEITPLAMIGFLEVCEKSRLEHFHFYSEQDGAAKCGFS